MWLKCTRNCSLVRCILCLFLFRVSQILGFSLSTRFVYRRITCILFTAIYCYDLFNFINLVLITGLPPAIPPSLLPAVYGNPEVSLTDYMTFTPRGVLMGKYKYFLTYCGLLMRIPVVPCIVYKTAHENTCFSQPCV